MTVLLGEGEEKAEMGEEQATPAEPTQQQEGGAKPEEKNEGNEGHVTLGINHMTVT